MTQVRGGFYWQLAIRLAGQLIAHGGRTGIEDARQVAIRAGSDGTLRRGDGSTKGSAASAATRTAIKALEQAKVAHRVTDKDGEALVATKGLVDVAAWIHDELAGLTDDDE